MNRNDNQPFSLDVRIYYEDTDAAGIVYHAHYLRFMERARSEWLRDHVVSAHELASRDSVLFAVRSVTIEFFKPARLDDLLAVTAEPTSIRGASLTLRQVCWRGGESICEAKVDLVCVDAETFAPRRLPPELAAMAAYVCAP